ncbi:MAG TPA: hypothetical protein ENK31_04025 [Nannocystis exedens]|nr:hypothetical protein [Nannocystis exedens]
MTTRLTLFAALAGIALTFACDVPLQERYELRSSTSIPKGIGYDSVAQVFYATALNGGEITLITSLGREYLFYASDDRKISFTAAAVDDERRVLWVCAVDRKSEPALPKSSILGFDLDEQEIVHRVDLGDLRDRFAPSACEALDVSKEGIVYAADALQPVIYRFDPGSTEASIFVDDATLAPPHEGGVGLSGVALHPDGEHLLAAMSDPPRLFVIAIDEPTALQEVLFPDKALGRVGDPRLPAAAGIGFVGEQLYVAFPGAVQQLTFADQDQLRTAHVKTTVKVPNGISALTAADGAAYAIDSDAYRVEQLGLQPDGEFSIVRVSPQLFQEDK